ncbi:DUF6879 family protein [Nocardia sp. NPDC050710]|uniref:DUF6879 family protein n=1 Tax=Nocardia sp. NPDC050710 TaxID=3157220 RepID=UPI0033C65B79
MLHLTGSDFTDLFQTCQRSAFHLEVHDTYQTLEESEPFRRFLADEPDDYEWLHGWLNVVRDATSRGAVVQRVRVVTEPHVDYTRWGLVVARANIEAGEDIRYLPRKLVSVDELPADDYWLFDDNTVAYTLFTPAGAASGAAVTTDPVIVQRCAAIRDMVWRRAISHADYTRTTVTS